ncbi:complement regulator-acquiring protein [Borrelia sp. HM]|uniref:complement regulator-acquiring protein n=1 Tax=Borrelia sp. HM TaxID=1882662 RepID=UPI001C74BE50|nr:complement regulator-acquiring protein [Borrelia sp. HM]BCR22254.1 hypothetical protein BKFM_00850 [Borrelia sp. HM]
MRKNLFLYTLLMVGMMSCNLDSKLLLGGDKEKTKEEGNKVPIGKDEREQLISALIYDVDNVRKMVSQDKVEVEDINQYGMKDEVFKAVINTLNGKTLEHDNNKEARRLFYSSLLYNKERIKDFAEILKKIESDETKGTWIKDIIDAGREHLQSNFERVVNKLADNRDKLGKLSLDDLREVKSKFEEIQIQRLAFRKAVNSLIASYKAKTGGIDSDSKKLIAHVDKEYKNLIKVKIPGMKSVFDRIVVILDTIK